MKVEVLIEIKAKGITKTFTYSVPNNLENMIKKGIRVLVPFGSQQLEGFILDITNHDVDYEVRDIIDVIDMKPVLNDELIDLGDYISKKYLCNLISAYQTMLPKALKASHNTKVNKKYITYLELIDKDYNPNSNTQKEIIDLFNLNELIIKKEASLISTSSVKTLINKKVLGEKKVEEYRIRNNNSAEKTNIKYTDEQINAINGVDLNKFDPYLLHGVTGSGKTEVYMALIDKVIKKGKEVIVLVPEISLTAQLINIFRNRFGNIAILHSRLSDGERYDEYRKIVNHDVSIAIGARSCIFAPFTNLGLVVIDEEHTETYKQENNPRYNAIEVGIYRAKKHNIPIILGSATPSLESYTRAKLGVYKLLKMKNRVNKNMPSVKLVDMKEEIKHGNKIFSYDLKKAINENLENHEQSIIFLNRRGYSTIVTCHNCGYVDKCPNCDLPLIYHKNSNNNRCHYCNYTSPSLIKCPKCGSSDINTFGMGTEKLEDEVHKMFPSARIVRMDLDTTSRKNAHEEIINDFKDFRYDILIGTQMIVKGLDFPNVTLVGVLNGDSSLNMPDFRSSERTFNLLSQVAGRSGRSSKKGRVIIQGFNMDHYSILKARDNDYIGFYNEEIKIRKALNYPPYCSICLLEVKSNDYDTAIKHAKDVCTYLKNNINNTILGPTMENRINNVYTMQIIIKYKKLNEIMDYIKFINDKYLINSKVRVEITFNPLRT